jgi:hypothetical protein
MEDHGGQVTLDDRPDGPGTVATLVLPLSHELANGGGAQGGAAKVGGPNGSGPGTRLTAAAAIQNGALPHGA